MATLIDKCQRYIEDVEYMIMVAVSALKFIT